VIKEYFLNYGPLNSDFTVNLATHEVTYHSPHHDEDWDVTIAYTGEFAMTGARLAQAAGKYLGPAQHFALTYGDGLCDVDLLAEFGFHRQHNHIGTMLAINAPPSRFGELRADINTVTEFSEKPISRDSWINGGYFFFRKEFLQYLSYDEQSALEKDVLVNLARDRQLEIYRHEGFWACMDTQRDRDSLEELWASGRAPWATKNCRVVTRDID
jgi:glucose-1-phosphate cytidylyltransferase